MIVVPSIVTADPAELRLRLSQAESFSDRAQVDFFDEVFVPGYRSVDPADLDELRTSLKLTAHILAYGPEKLLPALVRAGFSGVIIHYETTEDCPAVIRTARKLKLRTGLAIAPGTPIEALEPFYRLVDEAVFLAVDPRQPRQFIPAVLEKIRAWLAAHGAIRKVAIDGGINFANIKSVARSGADIAYVGNAVFGRGDPAENFRLLVRAAKN